MYLPKTSYQAQGASDDFSEPISTLQEVARGIESAKIESQITTAKGLEMVKLALDLGRGMTKTAQEMDAKLVNILVQDQIFLAADSSFQSIQKNIMPLLQNVVQPAQRAGQALISSAGFQQAISSHIRAIIRGYETLAFLEDIKPTILRILGGALTIASKIGDAFLSVAEVISAPFKAAVDAAGELGDKLEEGKDIVMWATIGGIAFLVYWYGLRKK
jgi:predicted RecB family endonuclease